jgi:hypothetical protein
VSNGDFTGLLKAYCDSTNCTLSSPVAAISPTFLGPYLLTPAPTSFPVSSLSQSASSLNYTYIAAGGVSAFILIVCLVGLYYWMHTVRKKMETTDALNIDRWMKTSDGEINLYHFQNNKSLDVSQENPMMSLTYSVKKKIQKTLLELQNPLFKRELVNSDRKSIRMTLAHGSFDAGALNEEYMNTFSYEVKVDPESEFSNKIYIHDLMVTAVDHEVKPSSDNEFEGKMYVRDSMVTSVNDEVKTCTESELCENVYIRESMLEERK